VDSLPELENGEAWVCSPRFLKFMKRIHFDRCRTFDSGATPMVGASRSVATLADIELRLGDLRGQMSPVVERAAQDDPQLLRRRIDELGRELRSMAATDRGLLPLARSLGALAREHVLAPQLPGPLVGGALDCVGSPPVTGESVAYRHVVSFHGGNRSRTLQRGPAAPSSSARTVAPSQLCLTERIRRRRDRATRRSDRLGLQPRQASALLQLLRTCRSTSLRRFAGRSPAR